MGGVGGGIVRVKSTEIGATRVVTGRSWFELPFANLFPPPMVTPLHFLSWLEFAIFVTKSLLNNRNMARWNPLCIPTHSAWLSTNVQPNHLEKQESRDFWNKRFLPLLQFGYCEPCFESFDRASRIRLANWLLIANQRTLVPVQRLVIILLPFIHMSNFLDCIQGWNVVRTKWILTPGQRSSVPFQSLVKLPLPGKQISHVVDCMKGREVFRTKWLLEAGQCSLKPLHRFLILGLLAIHCSSAVNRPEGPDVIWTKCRLITNQCFLKPLQRLVVILTLVKHKGHMVDCI